MAAQARKVDNRSIGSVPAYSKDLRNFTIGALVTMFALMVLLAYLSPFGYMTLTSLKSEGQLTQSDILPLSPITYTYDGPPIEDFRVETGDVMNLYMVEVEGEERELALAVPRRQESYFIDPSAEIDPENPADSLILWEGNWRTLERDDKLVKEFDPHLENFETAWRGVQSLTFPRLIRNTLVIAVLGMIGTIISSICVAYAFARFPLPGKEILFLILISTIVLPRQVTLVPTYAFFKTIGWTGTWLPLIVPHFFANAYNVFLLRQFFRTLPRELDEAAMIDGAGPFRILWSVIIPQSYPAIVAIALFHFVFAWNDYFEPLIYLLGRRDLVPISVGIQQFNFVFDQEPHLIQSTALMGLAIPVLLFFFAQRVFMRGIVITGVDK